MRNDKFNFSGLLLTAALASLVWFLNYIVGMPTTKTMNGILVGMTTVSALLFAISIGTPRAFFLPAIISGSWALVFIAGLIGCFSTVVSLLWKVEFPTYYGLFSAATTQQWHGFAITLGVVAIPVSLIALFAYDEAQKMVKISDGKEQSKSSTVGGFVTSS